MNLNQEIDLKFVSELGKKSEYTSIYSPDKLLPIARAQKRIEIGIDPSKLPFHGHDGWNHYEVSWLNMKGKPMVALAEMSYDCKSTHIIESKSFKLYFNSFNNTKIQSAELLEQIIRQDVSQLIGSDVKVKIKLLGDTGLNILDKDNFLVNRAKCLDNIDIACSDSDYLVNPDFLTLDQNTQEIVEEILFSDLLKSNCLVTHQPDWGTLYVAYKGKKINHEGLLRYIISYRNHNEFHEQCIERIFVDIMQHCAPEELTVYGRYTRRGGLDINPYRTTKIGPDSLLLGYIDKRLVRQ